MGIIVEVVHVWEHEAERQLMVEVSANNLRIKGSPTYRTVYTKDNALRHSITAVCVWRDPAPHQIVSILHPTFPVVRFVRETCETCGYTKIDPDTKECSVCHNDCVPSDKLHAFVRETCLLCKREDIPQLVSELLQRVKTLLPSDPRGIDLQTLTRRVVEALVVLEDML